MSTLEQLAALEDHDGFVRRHLGPSEGEIAAMLAAIGAESLDAMTARTVPAALAFFTGASQFESPTGAISAAAIIVTIPIVILVLAFQRQIVAGLTNGAVKG